MATIKEVAKLAGVGTSTVSRYINKQGYVSEESKRKIKKACEDLEYVPSELARAMKSNQSKTIGVMIPTIHNPFFTELVHVIEQSLLSKGYKTVLCNTNGDIVLEKNYINMAITNRFDGIILITGSNEFMELKLEIPVILLDRVDLEESKYITVTTDNRQGTILATDHMIKCGCKNIAFIGPDLESYPSKTRERVFKESMELNQLRYKILKESEITGELLQKEIIAGIDGIFAWNDIVAIKCISMLLEREIKIPKDIQIVGYDNIELSEIIHPKLTTIAQPIAELGKLASEYIVGIIENGKEEISSIQLENQLIIRNSTNPR